MARPTEFPIKKVIGFKQEMLDAIDNYRRKEPDLPARSEAIRRLIEKALKEG